MMMLLIVSLLALSFLITCVSLVCGLHQCNRNLGKTKRENGCECQNTLNSDNLFTFSAAGLLSSIRRYGIHHLKEEFVWFTCGGNQLRLPVREKNILPSPSARRAIHSMYTHKAAVSGRIQVRKSNEDDDLLLNNVHNPLSPEEAVNNDQFVRRAISGAVSIQDDAKTKCEDAFFCSFNGQAMGIADGVGGTTSKTAASGDFARQLMLSCSKAYHEWGSQQITNEASCRQNTNGTLTSCTMGNTETKSPNPRVVFSPKGDRALQPSDIAAAIICSAYKSTLRECVDGSSTIVVAYLQPTKLASSQNEPSSSPAASSIEKRSTLSDSGKGESLYPTRSILGIASIGDSCCMILRRNAGSGERQIIFRSEEQQHFFNCPRQIGRFGVEECDSPAHSARYNVEVCRGDLLLLGTDGLFDNLWEREVVAICDRFVSPRDVENLAARRVFFPFELPLQHTAPFVVATILSSVAYSRSRDILVKTPWGKRRSRIAALFQGGKRDDITVVAAWVD
eukprot:GHVN01008321.1.p1 GENE.GHVN01008321.1~~GHVN01008321.1.p1  ORF type:complete len:508 (+),score=43.43 GHVN01008321.1:483-2006(+)